MSLFFSLQWSIPAPSPSPRLLCRALLHLYTNQLARGSFTARRYRSQRRRRRGRQQRRTTNDDDNNNNNNNNCYNRRRPRRRRRRLTSFRDRPTDGRTDRQTKQHSCAWSSTAAATAAAAATRAPFVLSPRLASPRVVQPAHSFPKILYYHLPYALRVEPGDCDCDCDCDDNSPS